MADRMDGDAAGVKSVSREFREHDEKSNALPRKHPLRHIRPPQRYIEDEWVPVKARQITVEEETVEKQSSSGRSGQRSNKSSSSSKLSSHTNSTRGSGTRRQQRLQELKLLQAKREADTGEFQERRLAEEDLSRREEERRLSELRRIRELEYEAKWLRLQAGLEEEEEQRNPESLTNRLRDSEGDEKDDQGLEGANMQSTPYHADTRSPMSNTILTTERSGCNASVVVEVTL